MISSWRKKRASRETHGAGPQQELESSELVTPTHFRCPISLDLMKDPVTLSTGITYDRDSIETWIEAGNKTCPLTKQALTTLEPVPNHTLRRMIQDWGVENRAHGVERIPTPRVPVSSTKAAEILGQISTNKLGPKECSQLVSHIITSMKESERNKKCFVANEVARTLAASFKSFADVEGDDVVLLLGKLMGGLVLTFPLDAESVGHMGSGVPLARLLWLLRRGGLSSRRNAVLILKELISSSKEKDKIVSQVGATQGGIESLVELIKEPLCPASLKASLTVIYNIMMITSPSDANAIGSRLVELGLVPLILDILVDGEKSICEKGLGVLDRLCRTGPGLEAAVKHSLTVPVVVKKILRVSGLATELSVGVLWRLSRQAEESVVVEALQVGAFQKLLLILQVGWNLEERTKEKVTKLLKVLNGYRGRVECVDSMDFKHLNRPF